MDSGKFVFLWKIENFSMLPHRNNEPLYSSYFKVGFLRNTDWKMKLYPRGFAGFEESLSCYLLRKLDNSTESIKVGFKVTIKSVHSQFNIIETNEYHEFFPAFYYGYPHLKSLKDIFDTENGYLPQDVLTLECQMWFVENEQVNQILELKPAFTEKCASISQVKVSKRCFTWPIMKIKEFSKYNINHFINISSALDDTPVFKMLFSLSKDTHSEYAKIQISQTRLFSRSISHFVKVKITVVTTQKKYEHSQEDTFLFTSNNKGQIWKFQDFIKTEDLSEDIYVNPDGTLYLLCEFSFTTGNEVSHVEIPTYFEEIFQNMIDSQSLSPLTSTIQNLYISKKLCDITLQVGNQSFPAQKYILCAQSPVFCAMFTNDMKEKHTNVIDIKDIEADTLKLLLEFLHSNIMKEGLSFEEVVKLYVAADKYQIALLKQGCVLSLLALMSAENVGDILIVADRHNDNFLLTHITNFLKMNAVVVFHSPQWKEFLKEDAKLFGNIMIKVLQDS